MLSVSRRCNAGRSLRRRRSFYSRSTDSLAYLRVGGWLAAYSRLMEVYVSRDRSTVIIVNSALTVQSYFVFSCLNATLFHAKQIYKSRIITGAWSCGVFRILKKVHTRAGFTDVGVPVRHLWGLQRSRSRFLSLSRSAV